MATNRNRLKGKAISFTADNGDEFKCDLTSVMLDPEEGDDDGLTFCDAEAGGVVQWLLKFNALQSTDLDSLWSFCWDHSGEVVSCMFAPHGNSTPTADRPIFTFDVRMGMKPPIGGEADSTWLFEREFKLEGDPIMDRGTTEAPDPDAG